MRKTNVQLSSQIVGEVAGGIYSVQKRSCRVAVFTQSFAFFVFVFQSASGPGLTFIAFTEAIVKMPASPIWSVLFFCMLLTLGLGSMFGTLEGVITPFYDMKIVPFRKEIMTGMY